MLKKAGIVVAVATAGVLALSPLAFASSPDQHGDHHGDRQHHSAQHSDVDLDYTNIQRDNQSNDCEFNQGGTDVDSFTAGGSDLLGILNPVVSAVVPVTAQVNALNCVNVDDVLDIASTENSFFFDD